MSIFADEHIFAAEIQAFIKCTKAVQAKMDSEDRMSGAEILNWYEKNKDELNAKSAPRISKFGSIKDSRTYVIFRKNTTLLRLCGLSRKPMMSIMSASKRLPFCQRDIGTSPNP